MTNAFEWTVQVSHVSGMVKVFTVVPPVATIMALSEALLAPDDLTKFSIVRVPVDKNGIPISLKAWCICIGCDKAMEAGTSPPLCPSCQQAVFKTSD